MLYVAIETTRAIQFFLGSDHLALIDSYVNDFHCTAVTGACTDAQTIAGTNGGATIKIVNNFLEASGENILFGGGPGQVLTTDVEVRRNHMFKPLTWSPSDPKFLGTKFIVKNLLELKEGKRVFFEGNLLENTWGGFTQTGSAILLTPKNAGTCSVCELSDVIIR